MNKILSLILVMIAVALPMTAQDSNGNSNSKHVELKLKHNHTTPTMVHAPMHINIDVYYSEETGTLEVCYDGETTGEVYLYLDNNVIGYSSEINSAFQITDPGCYTIEIVTDSWIAEGHIQL